MPSFNEFLCLMETGPYLPENSCNVCYWKAKWKATFYVGFVRRKTWFLPCKEKQVAQRKTRCYGRIFSWHRLLCSFRVKDQELFPDGAYLGLKLLLFRKITFVLSKKNGWHQKEKLVFSMLSLNLTSPSVNGFPYNENRCFSPVVFITCMWHVIYQFL